MEKLSNVVTNCNKDVTLSELLKQISAEKKPEAKMLPSHLIAIGKPIAEAHDCTVFDNGYALYCNNTGKTCFWLASYKNQLKEYYRCNFDKKTQSLSINALIDAPWYITVLYLGEIRIEDNCKNKLYHEGKTKGKYLDFEIAIREFESPELLNPENLIVDNSICDEFEKSLTDKQKEVYTYCVKYKCTKKEAAQQIGITPPAVSQHMAAIRKKAKKFFSIP